MTTGLEGEKIVDLEANMRAGAVAFSDDGKCVMKTEVNEEIFKRASELDVLLILSASLCLGLFNDTSCSA
jgi:dihydroorotase